MREITLEASIDNIEKVTAFLDSFLEDNECPMKAQMQLDIAMDELFSNIAHYAYAPDTGDATVRLDTTSDKPGVTVTYIDSGLFYNPLEKEDPDVSLSADERSIGGLGIFMVKKLMDNIEYKYEDSQNILTITKYF